MRDISHLDPKKLTGMVRVCLCVFMVSFLSRKCPPARRKLQLCVFVGV
jgi:hypothetical protein